MGPEHGGDRISGASALASVTEQQFRAALDAVPDVVFVFVARRDESGALVDMEYRAVNAAGLAMFGRPEEDIVGHGYLELFPSERGGESWQRGVEVLETGQSAAYDVAWTDSDGNELTIAVRMAPFGDGLIMTVRDVSERLRTEEALRHQRDFTDALLDVADVLICVTDAEGRIVRLNRQAEQLSGYRESDLLGQHYEVFVAPAERAEVARALEHVSSDEPVQFVNHVVLSTGELRLLRWSFAPLYDNSGRLTHLVAVALDITEQRRTEEELARRAAETDRANRELERSNADLEQFASIASHDLRAPLRTVAGHVNLIARRLKATLDADTAESVDFAVRGCEQMQGMIDGLLSFSRVGRGETTVGRADAEQVLEDVLATLERSLVSAGAVVTAEPLPIVAIDPDQLAQVFQNLIGNGAKFVAPGVTPRIEIAAQPSGTMWRITVTDNGIGIPAHQRDRVFTMFRRLHPEDQYAGTGVGLAIVKKIVERNGGEVGVEDASGGTGSCFWFVLPAARH